MLEYCTLPRTGALEVVFDVLGGKTKNGAINNGFNSHSSTISKICDVTIAYPNGKPLDLFQIAAGHREPCTTHVHYRVFDVKDVSTKILKVWFKKMTVNQKYSFIKNSTIFFCTTPYYLLEIKDQEFH